MEKLTGRQLREWWAKYYEAAYSGSTRNSEESAAYAYEMLAERLNAMMHLVILPRDGDSLGCVTSTSTVTMLNPNPWQNMTRGDLDALLRIRPALVAQRRALLDAAKLINNSRNASEPTAEFGPRDHHHASCAYRHGGEKCTC